MKRLAFISALFLTLLCACDSSNDPDKKEGPLTMIVDRNVIKADNEYASTLTVFLRDPAGSGKLIDITADAEIYCEETGESVTNPRFVTDKAGVYTFYAIYGFDMSEPVVVKAVSGVEDLPADSKPESTSFRQRMLLLQHTGTTCPNCPKLMTPLRNLSEDENYNTKYHHVASHSYRDTDPAYSEDAAELSKNMNVEYYPWLTFNLTSDNTKDYTNLPAEVDSRYKETAAAGVSATVSLTDGDINAQISLKAGQTGKYRLAAWLLEDNIHEIQSNATASWQNNHSNCLRKMNGETRSERIFGKNIGEIQKGQTHDFIVSFDLASGWVGENCKVLVLAVDADYKLITCALCPIGESVGYEYL